MIEFISQFQAQYASGGGGGQAQYGGETDDNIAMLEKAVPGTPGEDYPIYAEVFMNIGAKPSQKIESVNVAFLF